MQSLQTITLGAPPKDPNEGDERVKNAMAILELGFPDGVILLCSRCNQFQEYGLDEVAVMIVDQTWPRCCSTRMLMEDPEKAPAY